MQKFIAIPLFLLILLCFSCTNHYGFLKIVENQPSKEYIIAEYGEITFSSNVITEKMFTKFIQGVKDKISMNENYSEKNKVKLILEWSKLKYEKNRIFGWGFNSKKIISGKSLQFKFNIVGQDKIKYLEKIMKYGQTITTTQYGTRFYGHSWLIIANTGLFQGNVPNQPYYIIVTFPNGEKIRYLITM